MDDGCTIDGADALYNTLKEMGPSLVRKALKDALDCSGSVVQEAAMANAPVAEVGTEIHPAGQLKLDVRRKSKIDMAEGVGTCAIYFSKHSFYGAFSEFGTSKEPARPWLRPAFTESKDDAVDVFCTVIQAAISDYCKGKK